MSNGTYHFPQPFISECLKSQAEAVVQSHAQVLSAKPMVKAIPEKQFACEQRALLEMFYRANPGLNPHELAAERDREKIRAAKQHSAMVLDALLATCARPLSIPAPKAFPDTETL